MNRTCLLVVATLCLVSGCKKKSEPTTYGDTTGPDANEKKQVDALEVKLKFVEGLKGKLPPATAADAVAYDGKAPGGTWWVYEEDLANVETTPKGSRLEYVETIRKCAKDARHPDFGKYDFSRLRTCADAKYVFVVRTLARTEPKVVSKAEGMNNGKFTPGVATGDVVGYDLTTQKPIGGYRWSGKNDDSVMGGEMMKDFEENILEAIKAGQRKYLK